MLRHGVVLPRHQTELALRLGADYVEPLVLRNLVSVDDSGVCTVLDGDPVPPAPSFAVLIPATLPIADPSVPMEQIRRYLDFVLSVISPLAEPGAAVVLGSGRSRTIPDGVAESAGRDRFAEVVRLAHDLTRTVNLRLLLEPLNTAETNLIHTIGEAVDFLDAAGMSEVGVVADLFHLMRAQEPLEVVHEQAHRVGHIHIADTDRVPPGQGDWPMAEFLTALRTGGQLGPVSIECIWDDPLTELGPALEAVRQAEPDLQQS